MRRVMAVTIFAILVLGVLFPVKSTSQGKSHFFQAIKDVFHYYPDTQKATVKETPTRFEDTMKKQTRYPEQKSETK